MSDILHPPETALLFSGGLDSAILLDQLLDRGWKVVPIYVRTGCLWQDAEQAAIERFLANIAQPNLIDLVVVEMPLNDLYGNHWSMSGNHVPDEATPDEAVFLPGRNPLLLLKPAVWCQLNGIDQIAIATLAGNPFPDATSAFFARFEAMLHEALGGQLTVARPFERMTKSRVMEFGRDLPLELTFSCLAPIDGRHCGHCNKCVERHRAFLEAGFEDPTKYAEFSSHDMIRHARN